MSKEVRFKREGFGEPIDSVRIVSSVHNPYAVSDTLRGILKQTKETLLISSPWIGKNFVDMIRNNVSKGVEIRLLTKTPDERNMESERYTHITLESFNEVSNSQGYKSRIMCNPFLHLKLIIADYKVVASGSVNFTSSGIYYNGEVLNLFYHPEHIKQYVDIFDKLWTDDRNNSWEEILYSKESRTYSKDYKKFTTTI